VDEPLTRDLEADRARVYGALREGRCYIANDQVADARGFQFWADGPRAIPMGGEDNSEARWTLHARLPHAARILIRRDGLVHAEADADGITSVASGSGVYRVEATMRGRPWIYSNPIYLRAT
jgi:hypothetical protein